MRTGVASAVAIQKSSSPDYLRAIFAAWRDRVAVVAADDFTRMDLPAVEVANRISVGPGGGWFEERLEPDDNPAAAQISFTSGTTGTPKPILLSRRALSDVTARLIDITELDGTAREYLGVPVTFSFGLGRARAVAAVGGRSFLPPSGFRPAELAGMLADGVVNGLSAVPTMLRLVLTQRHLFDGCGARLKWLEIGSQPMSADEKRAIRDLFREARIVQHYGLTEASRSTFLDIGSADAGLLESVGKPNGRVEMRVEGDNRIWVRGPHVADGVLTPDGLVPLTDQYGWLRTSDLGTLDQAGFLHFRGRSDHLLNVGGIKVPLDLFEQELLNKFPSDGSGVAAAGRSDLLRGEAVMVAYEPTIDLRVLGDRVMEVARDFGLGPTDVSLVPVPSIPRTETGKVRRRELAAAYRTAGPSKSDSSGAVADDLAKLLNRPEVDPGASYVDLGGDSLTFVQVSLLLEDKLGYLPDDWESMPVAELDRLAAERGSDHLQSARSMDSHIVLRALAITGVVLNHATPTQIGGGAFLLLALAGTLFARFQHRRFTSGQIVRGPAPFLLRILVAYYLVLVGYQIGRGDVDVRHWLLVSNFWPSLQSEHGLLPYYWFILAFIQVVILYALLFAVPAYRRRSEEEPWRTGFMTMAVGFAIALAGRVILGNLDAQPDMMAGHFAHRTPMFLFYLFAFGWCLHFTRTHRQRLWMMAAALVTFPLIGVLPYALWLVLGSLIAIWVPRIWVPGPLRRVIAAIASASFYIFIIHLIPLEIIRRLAPERPLLLGMAATLLAVMLGLFVAVVVRVLERGTVRLVGRPSMLAPANPAAS